MPLAINEMLPYLSNIQSQNLAANLTIQKETY